jgi:hypothetical protein
MAHARRSIPVYLPETTSSKPKASLSRLSTHLPTLDLLHHSSRQKRGISPQVCSLETHERRTRPNTLCSVETDKHRCYTSNKKFGDVGDVPGHATGLLSLPPSYHVYHRDALVRHASHPPTDLAARRTSLPRGREPWSNVVKLGCQHVRCLQCICKCKCKCKLSCLHGGRRHGTSVPPLGNLGRLTGSIRLATACIAAIEVDWELADCFCSCSKLTLFPLPGRHPFVPEHAMGPWYGMWSDRGCLTQARQGAAG